MTNRRSTRNAIVNPTNSLHRQGQAIWLDFLARRFTLEGSLKKLIEEDSLTGVTSNPSIFKKAIAGSSDYDASLIAVLHDADCDAMTLYERLAIEDIRNAADALHPVYEQTKRADGFVSLEVSPYLANDTDATIAEARRLCKEVGRENVMIKVPGTEAGLPAIRQLLGEGINVNITLLFSRAVYSQVAEAYLAGLERYIAGGGDPARLASVASFFVSRIDTAVDRLIEEQLKKLPAGGATQELADLRGKIAIANAKLAYRDYTRFFAGPRWRKLSDAGARVQRLLWASTSTKNPAFRDVLYVEELIGPDTINTLPPETLDAFRDHGSIRPSLEENIAAAENMLTMLGQFGISLDAVTAKLTREGVQLFADSFDDLLAAVESKRAAKLGPALNRLSANLPPDVDKTVKATLDDWRKCGTVRRLWGRDARLWTGADEAKWLGWLDIVTQERRDIGRLEELAANVRKAKFTHAVLLGMGGSSLGAEVFAMTFGATAGYPKLVVLDSTDPAEIKRIDDAVELAHTLFIVSSKSGTTLEPNILKDYFYARAEGALGKGRAGPHFIALTDPGSKLEAVARDKQFRNVCAGKPDIGGRYSVLSDFGLVPAAAMGVDVARLLASTATMVRSCGANVPPGENPGVRLGAILGTLEKAGRDKLTIIASPGIAEIGAWLEQLLAESTGKNGKGMIPVDGEPLGPASVYGKDRVFVYLRLDQEADAAQDDAVSQLEQAGQPVVRIAIADRYRLGQEFFRWEIATAVAGAIIGVNPFDQPDVEASKVKTRALMQAYERQGSLPPEAPFLDEHGIKLYADENNSRVLKQAGDGTALVSSLKAHLARAGAGDYCALIAYIARDDKYRTALQDIRAIIRDRRRVATCLGFGPRFLHSTGQAYKGGPNTGVFVQITAEHAADLAVPGHTYSFGAAIDATARGDFAVLNERGRRALRVHLGVDVETGLARLKDAVKQALA
jgi:transaldolase/glucose-6-phosphate isomerase